MDITYLLLTIPQWIIFVSIVVIFYGWIENKKVFWEIGAFSLVLLGAFALYALLSKLVSPDIFISEDELNQEVLDMSEIPRALHMVPIYWGLTLNGILSLITFISEMKKNKHYKWLTVVTILFCLAIFFMLLNALNT